MIQKDKKKYPPRENYSDNERFKYGCTYWVSSIFISLILLVFLIPFSIPIIGPLLLVIVSLSIFFFYSINNFKKYIRLNKEIKDFQDSKLEHLPGSCRNINDVSYFYFFTDKYDASDLLNLDLERYMQETLLNESTFSLNDHKNNMFKGKIFENLYSDDLKVEIKNQVEKQFENISHEDEMNNLKSLGLDCRLNNKIYALNKQNSEFPEEDLVINLLKRVKQSNNIEQFKHEFFVKKGRNPDISEILQLLNLELDEIKNIQQKGEKAFQKIYDIYIDFVNEKFIRKSERLFRSGNHIKSKTLYEMGFVEESYLDEFQILLECFFISSIKHFNPFNKKILFEDFLYHWIVLGLDKLLTPKILTLYKEGKVIKNFNIIDIDLFYKLVFKDDHQILNKYGENNIFFALFQTPNIYFSLSKLSSEAAFPYEEVLRNRKRRERFFSKDHVDKQLSFIKIDFIRVLFSMILQIEGRNTNLKYFSFAYKYNSHDFVEFDFKTKDLVKYCDKFDQIFIKMNLNTKNKKEKFFDDEALKKSLENFKE